MNAGINPAEQAEYRGLGRKWPKRGKICRFGPFANPRFFQLPPRRDSNKVEDVNSRKNFTLTCLLCVAMLPAVVQAQTWVTTNLPLPSAYERGFRDDKGAAWIQTNAPRSNGAFDYLRELELNPYINDTNIPHASDYYNNAFRLLFRQKHEALVIQVHGAATYGGKIVADYDIRDMGGVNTNELAAKEVYLASLTNQIHMTAGYYRGRIYYALPIQPDDKWVTVFTSEDKTKLVSVRDEGPVYFSENSGLTWEVISRPGQYEFTLATTPKGSTIVARVSVGKISAASDLAAIQRLAFENWYSVVSAANRSKLVMTGGPSQSAPVLSIEPSRQCGGSHMAGILHEFCPATERRLNDNELGKCCKPGQSG